MKEKLVAFKGNKTQYTFVGHSLGGALSTLAAYFMSSEIADKKYMVVSYGSPKVGDQNFVNTYNSKNIVTYRIVNEKDPIPSTPLESQGFREIYPEYWLRNGKLIECPGDCRRSITMDAGDHSITSYLANLKAYNLMPSGAKPLRYYLSIIILVICMFI